MVYKNSDGNHRARVNDRYFGRLLNEDNNNGRYNKTPVSLNGIAEIPENSRPLAMVYSPYQSFENIYDITDGINRGTIFKELDFPFYPSACCNEPKI